MRQAREKTHEGTKEKENEVGRTETKSAGKEGRDSLRCRPGDIALVARKSGGRLILRRIVKMQR